MNKNSESYEYGKMLSSNAISSPYDGLGGGCLFWIIIIILFISVAIFCGIKDLSKEQNHKNATEQSIRTEQSGESDASIEDNASDGEESLYPDYDEFVNQQIEDYYEQQEREYYQNNQYEPYHF